MSATEPDFPSATVHVPLYMWPALRLLLVRHGYHLKPIGDTADADQFELGWRAGAAEEVRPGPWL